MAKILTGLEEGLVVRISLEENNEFLLMTELGEDMMTIRLNKKESMQLIQELTELVNQMN